MKAADSTSGDSAGNRRRVLGLERDPGDHSFITLRGACRAFQSRLADLVERHDGKVRVVYLPFPLPSIHRLATAAAQAGDCALDVSTDALKEWISVVYDGQDSLGLKSWGSYAAAAGISDTAAIALCARNPVLRPRVQAGIAFGEKLDVSGTPTVLINGWHYRGLPSDRTMDSLITSLAK